MHAAQKSLTRIALGTLFLYAFLKVETTTLFQIINSGKCEFYSLRPISFR